MSTFIFKSFMSVMGVIVLTFLAAAGITMLVGGSYYLAFSLCVASVLVVFMMIRASINRRHRLHRKTQDLHSSAARMSPVTSVPHDRPIMTYKGQEFDLFNNNPAAPDMV